MIQPLSGEYAVRREVLEQIPFPVGYGVETSHLIDVYHRWGMSAFAQSDLDRRIHTNQSTDALGRMAFGILQTFLQRIDSLEIIRDLPELNVTLNQFMVDQGGYEELAHEIRVLERPPMIEIPPLPRQTKHRRRRRVNRPRFVVQEFAGTFADSRIRTHSSAEPQTESGSRRLRAMNPGTACRPVGRSGCE